MILRVLGSAAGGGSPQWNCDCAVCGATRRDERIPPRLTCTMAVGDGSGNWFLCNAGPDLGVQLRDWGALSPVRDHLPPPLHGVLLTDAELDHTVGLLSLRQAAGLRIYGTTSVRELLMECGLLPTLRCYTDVEWVDVHAGVQFDLRYQDGSISGISCGVVELGAGRLPRYARTTPNSSDAVIGYVVRDRRTGGSAAIAPSMLRDDELVVRDLAGTQLAIIDGTFYEDDELSRTGRSIALARSMGHLPIRDSPLGSRLKSRGAQVVYAHLNNTNPLILPDSPQRTSLTARGFVIAEDGAEFAI